MFYWNANINHVWLYVYTRMYVSMCLDSIQTVGLKSPKNADTVGRLIVRQVITVVTAWWSDGIFSFFQFFLVVTEVIVCRYVYMCNIMLMLFLNNASIQMHFCLFEILNKRAGNSSFSSVFVLFRSVTAFTVAVVKCAFCV